MIYSIANPDSLYNSYGVHVCIFLAKKNKSDEKPLYTKADQDSLYQEHMPEDMPMDKDSNKYKFLYEFCQDIKYIIQTVNENEYQAANTFMKAPHDGMFSSAVIYPENSMVIGFFGKAKIKAALIQTKPGPGVDNYIEKAIEAYPNAQYVLGVGVCFAFDRSKFPFGDVIVSSSIADFTMFKVTRENGEDKLKFENRGDTSSVDKHLHKTFCLDLERTKIRSYERQPLFEGSFRYNDLIICSCE